ncbi:MAG: hypothetical protein KDA62_19275, partial [Planctomycetales bacterium]|nr:hypothetical protein [Planctomycetales bacterium]
MIRAIDCDRTFDLLTRGPFPSGEASDMDVELHLRCCHDCRRLAEALQPAVSLFHESLTVEANTLPNYRGALATDRQPWLEPETPAVPIATLANRLRDEAAPLLTVRQFARRVALAMIAVAACGLLACGFWIARPESSAIATETPMMLASESGYLLSRNADQRLAGAGVPLACVHRASLEATSDASSAAAIHRLAVCCTQCHSDTRQNRAAVKSFGTLVAACLVCHQD